MRFVLIGLILAFLPVHSAVADMSWYLGAGGGATRLRTENFATTSGLNVGQPLPTDDAGSGEFSNTPAAWQIYGALMYTENFGFLVKYSDTGVSKKRWQGFREENGVRTDYNFDGRAQVKGFTIYALQTIPLSDRFEYTIEAGWTWQDLDLEWASAWNPSALSFDDSGFALGAVLRYKFLKWLAISGELEYLIVEFDDVLEKPIRYSLNLEFHF